MYKGLAGCDRLFNLKYVIIQTKSCDRSIYWWYYHELLGLGLWMKRLYYWKLKQRTSNMRATKFKYYYYPWVVPSFSFVMWLYSLMTSIVLSDIWYCIMALYNTCYLSLFKSSSDFHFKHGCAFLFFNFLLSNSVISKNVQCYLG